MVVGEGYTLVQHSGLGHRSGLESSQVVKQQPSGHVYTSLYGTLLRCHALVLPFGSTAHVWVVTVWRTGTFCCYIAVVEHYAQEAHCYGDIAGNHV